MTNFRNINQQKIRKVMDSTTGPASYASATRPTIAFNQLRGIDSVADIKLWAEGYTVVPVSISCNVVTYKVLSAPAHTHILTASGALATHQHDITTVGTAGGDNITEPAIAGALEDAGAGGTMANAVDAKTAGTPAGTNAVQTRAADSEVIDTTNLSGVTIYGEAVGW